MTGDASDERPPREAGGGYREYATRYHAPVLCNAVVDNLITDHAGTYVDGTLGGGGHTAALLDALKTEGRVVGIDRDEQACVEANGRLRSAVEQGRLTILRGDFAEMESLLAAQGISSVDGVLLDLGVSSRQLDEAERGFAYMLDGPLDMRMDTQSATSAFDLVNTWSESDLKKILREYGEEPRASRIARAICGARPLETTGQLAGIVRSCVSRADEIKTLSRVFQALRLTVNGEIEALECVLESATRIVRTGGRMAVISYHSLEDRRVKRFLRFGNFEGESRKDIYGNLLTTWSPITRRPVLPDKDELEANPRARSARLRIAQRTSETVKSGEQQN
jgi:16S rRNA (cytosine1402-N4)-methyltransferase